MKLVIIPILSLIFSLTLYVGVIAAMPYGGGGYSSGTYNQSSTPIVTSTIIAPTASVTLTPTPTSKGLIGKLPFTGILDDPLVLNRLALFGGIVSVLIGIGLAVYTRFKK